MKTQKFKRTLSLFLAMLMCVTTLFGMGTTAFAAEETDEVYLISYPRDGDANYGGEWGHNSLSFMNGWSTATSRFTTIRAMGSYEGNICYCIEPGVPQQTGNTFTKKGEDFWDEYPSSYNSTISPDDIKLFIGRIFQYGYTGTISTSWRSQNEGGDKLANAVATQLLIWETVVGERDADFNKVGTGGKSAIVEQISTNHPLYSRIMGYYNSIAASVQRHSKVPSFLAKSAGKAQNIELEWNGEAYTATLADTNGVLSDYVFSANASGIRFSVSGNTLTITADDAPSDTVTITAEKKNSQRRGVITWTDGVYGPNGKLQDTVTYAQTVNDPVKGYLNIKVSYGSAKIVKTSEDGKVEGISFTITGNGVNKTVVTGAGGVLCGEMARAYAQAGAKVAALDLNEEAVKKLADELTAEGFICKGYKANVLDAEALEAVHQQVLADLGPCDILINGAGGNNPRATTDNEYQHEAKEGQKTFFDLEPNGVDFVFKLNFQGTLLPTQAFAKDMVARKSGNILNISSMNAYIPLTKIPAYSGAKAAISNFTQWLATHFAGTGIRANAIAPGFLVSNQNRALLFNADGTPTARSAKILNGTPMGRFVDSKELLGGVFFLTDDEAASAITGVVLPIDCGFAAYSGV